MRELDYIDARQMAKAIARWRVAGDLPDEQLFEDNVACRYLNRRIAELTEEYVPHAVAAIKALGAEPLSAWQPIATAPTDGTHVILFWPQRPPADIGWWTIDERPPNRALSQGFKAHGDKCIPPEQPTHWMHCPQPPVIQKADAT